MIANLISPTTYQRYQTPALVLAAVGLAVSLFGAFLDLDQFWRSYLFAYVFWLEIGLGCLGVLMLHHLVGGRWSAMIRRLMESGAMTLPLMLLLFVPLVFGMGALYEWTHAGATAPGGPLEAKATYLNTPFFLVRAAVYFFVWLGLAYFLRRWSAQQDNSGDPMLALRMRRLSAVGMILYVLTATFAGYDWLMSLEPEWFSSIYGLLFIAGQALAALALAIIGLRLQTQDGVTDKRWIDTFNDLGNFLLGFVLIWAYFSFSQFLIIWSADIPEEAIWYVHRSQGGWLQVGMVLVALHFVLPFFLLLSRPLKRRVRWLTALAIVVFFTRAIDLFWLIAPAFYPDGVQIHWLDGVVLAAMGGGWIALFLRQWAKMAALPQHDVHLEGHG